MRRGGYDPGRWPTSSRCSSGQQRRGRRPRARVALHASRPRQPPDRIARQVAALPPDSVTGRVERESYLRRLDGLVFGDNPREGFFRGNEFLHPDLASASRSPPAGPRATRRGCRAEPEPGRGRADHARRGIHARSPAERRFFSGQGMAGSPRSDRINGLDAVTGSFAATTQSGPVRGVAAFIAHGGRVYNVLAYAIESRWSGYDAAVRQASAASPGSPTRPRSPSSRSAWAS